LKNNTPSRICGLLTARGRNPEWEKALEHISEHFHPISDKPRHTLFCKRLRDPVKLKEYIKRAASAPSTVRLSKLTDLLNRPTGLPCLLILRDFKEQIGENSSETCLVIVADCHGKLVSAYPLDSKKRD
jgi:hypothetical protein